jgi:hypothetical protein
LNNLIYFGLLNFLRIKINFVLETKVFLKNRIKTLVVDECLCLIEETSKKQGTDYSTTQVAATALTTLETSSIVSPPHTPAILQGAQQQSGTPGTKRKLFDYSKVKEKIQRQSSSTSADMRISVGKISLMYFE